MAPGDRMGPGAIIDRYVVEGLLGRGGMAEVWSVRHRVLGTRRALKLLVRVDPASMRRLLDEGRVQARLQHPNVLDVLDVVEHDGHYGLILPLVIGPSLAELVEHYRPTEDETAALLRALLDAVGAAHAAGVVHRDIKPANVLLELTEGGVVPRLADFGLAKVRESDQTTTRAGSTLGTPAYAAPEQLRDAAAIDGRSDLWSLGVTALEVLTGRRPFQGGSVVELRDAMERRTWTRPSALGLAEPWDAFFEALLDPDPSSRPPSCAAVRTALDGIVPPSDGDPLGPGTPLATAAWNQKSAPPEPLGNPGSSQGRTFGLSASDAWRTRLPRERDRFVGRESELAQLQALLDASPLVTLTGPGGTGKTRLALHAARVAANRFPGGCVFADLSEARTADGALFSVASAMDVPLGGTDPVTQLGRAFDARGRMLLVLDNLEQILDAASTLLGHWLEASRGLVVLATSREPLHLRGESVLPLDTLSLPASDSPVDVAASDAVALLVDRAKLAGQPIVIDSSTASELAELVRRLDGLPLAIELAAARMRSLPVARLLERLAHRFDLLAGRSRDLPPRQRTLRAALDWSWELLRPWERAALARLSVFDGGFTLEAAEAVVEVGEHPDAPLVEDILAELVDKSLVRVTARRHRDDSPGSAWPRFGLLVSVQEYAAEQLASGDPAAAAEAERRHGQHFARMGSARALEALDLRGGIPLRHALAHEVDNLAAAASRALARGDSEVANACALAAAEVFLLRGPMTAAERLLSEVLEAGAGGRETDIRRALATTHTMRGAYQEAWTLLSAARDQVEADGSPRQRAQVLERLSYVADRWEHPEDALGLATQALACVAGDDPITAIQAGMTRSYWTFRAGRFDEAEAALEVALARARAVGARRLEGRLLGNVGVVLSSVVGDLERAHDRISEAIELAHECGDSAAEAVFLANKAANALSLGRYQGALESIEAAQRMVERVGLVRALPSLTNTEAQLRIHLGQTDKAAERLAAGLSMARSLGDHYIVGKSLVNLSHIDFLRGQPDRAVARAEEALEAFSAASDTADMAWTEAIAARGLLALGETEAARQAIDRALSLLPDGARPDARYVHAALADVFIAEGDIDAAADTLAKLDADERSAPTGAGPGIDRYVEQVRERLHSQRQADDSPRPARPAGTS